MTTPSPSRPSALAVQCPFCGAKPGSPCVTIQAHVPVDNIHVSREEASRAAA